MAKKGEAKLQDGRRGADVRLMYETPCKQWSEETTPSLGTVKALCWSPLAQAHPGTWVALSCQ